MLTSTVNVPHRNLFINGEWKESTKGKRIPIINPTTEQSIGFLFCFFCRCLFFSFSAFDHGVITTSFYVYEWGAETQGIYPLGRRRMWILQLKLLGMLFIGTREKIGLVLPGLIAPTTSEPSLLRSNRSLIHNFHFAIHNF